MKTPCVGCGALAQGTRCRPCHFALVGSRSTGGRVGRYGAIYTAWKTMVQRCTNPKSSRYRYYGGRGIRVCERWRVFENFYADMGPRPTPKHSIEREDVNGDYTPQNCTWATVEVQRNNARSNVVLTFRGKTMTATQWAGWLGVKPMVILGRVRKGWSVERVLTQPNRYRGRPSPKWHEDGLHKRLARG